MLKKLWKKEDGQALVLAALLLATLLGFAALVIDVGSLQVEKQRLQTVVDAAALAGAQELPDANAARKTAEAYAEMNGVDKSSLVITTPYDGSPNMIEVVSTARVAYTFAGILGFQEGDVTARAVARYGIAGSVPWIVPFVIPEPPAFNYDSVYVMRMYGAGPYKLNYSYPRDFTNKYSSYISSKYKYVTSGSNVSVYSSSNSNNVSFRIPASGTEVTVNQTGNARYQITHSRKSGWVRTSDLEKLPLTTYPYQFDYMNVKIDAAQSHRDYLRYLENGYHKTYSVNQLMQYYDASSGGRESVDTFAKRISADKNTNYKKAKVGDPRVMLIPVVKEILPRNTQEGTPIKIIGFAAFFLEKVYKNSYGESFWFEGRFLQDLNIGSGETTIDPHADFGLRVLQLVE